jgi:hypothetical protein
VNFNSHHLFLVADIDRVLSLTGDSEDVIKEQQKVLEKVRAFLVDFKPNAPVITADVAQTIAQTVVSEIDLKRSQWLQPLQLEINELTQQRQTILNEIRQLEANKQDTVADFLDLLMERFGRTLEGKINQTLKGAIYQLLSQNNDLNTVGDLPSFADMSLEYLAQLQQFQSNSDHLLKSLDLTLRTVFESLKIDIHAYENALTSGLKRIYELGQQSENALQDYLEPKNFHEPEIEVKLQPEQLNNLENLSHYHHEQLDSTIENTSVIEDEDWMETTIPPTKLAEETEIRPLLEIDLHEAYQQPESSTDLYFEPENELTTSTNLSPEENIEEELLLAENSYHFEAEKLVSFSSLEEILFEETDLISKEVVPTDQPVISSLPLPMTPSLDLSSPSLNAPTMINPEGELSSENQFMNTVQELTELLLEEGALNSSEPEQNFEENEPYHHETITSENENLLPNLERTRLETPDLEDNLTPDKLATLAEDLAHFGGEDLAPDVPEHSNNLNSFPSPWDASAQD